MVNRLGNCDIRIGLDAVIKFIAFGSFIFIFINYNNRIWDCIVICLDLISDKLALVLATDIGMLLWKIAIFCLYSLGISENSSISYRAYPLINSDSLIAQYLIHSDLRWIVVNRDFNRYWLSSFFNDILQIGMNFLRNIESFVMKIVIKLVLTLRKWFRWEHQSVFKVLRKPSFFILFFNDFNNILNHLFFLVYLPQVFI